MKCAFTCNVKGHEEEVIYPRQEPSAEPLRDKEEGVSSESFGMDSNARKDWSSNMHVWHCPCLAQLIDVEVV